MSIESKRQSLSIRRWSNRIAHVIGYVFNPLIFAPPLCGWIMAYSPGTNRGVAPVVGIVALCCTVWPGGVALWMVKSGRARSIDMPIRRTRVRAFAIGLLGYPLAGAFLAAVHPPATALLLTVLGCLALITLIVIFITPHWKISAHVSAGSGFASTTVSVAALQSWALSPPVVLLLGVVVVLLMWARWWAGVHSVTQIVAGAALGLIVPPLVVFTCSAFASPLAP